MGGKSVIHQASTLPKALKTQGEFDSRAVGSTAGLSQVRELVSAVQRLSLARSLEEVQAIVRTSARRLAGADGATFVLRDGAHCYYVDEDAIAPLWKGQRFPIETCISGWAMLNRQPTVIEDIYVDERIPHEAYRPTFVKSLVMVPMRSHDPVGAIGNYWAYQHRPSGQEVELLQALADSTAVAMENVRVYQELEQRVRDRTAALEDANERLVELDAIRTQFAHATTHELRSPLMAILGYSSLLAEQLPEAEAEQAALIFQSATRLSALVDDLLTVAELEHSELQLQREIVSIPALVSGSVRAFIAVADAEGISLHLAVAPEIEAYIDPLRVAQVLDNLISNALKYTPAGTHVEVRARQEGEQLLVEVADDGLGVSHDDKAKLFDPFYRASSGKTAQGTGLGLKISRDIAQAHGGDLTLEDTPGGGATFVLRLPLEHTNA